MPRRSPRPPPTPLPRPVPPQVDLFPVPPLAAGQHVSDTFGGALSATMDVLKALLMDQSSSNVADLPTSLVYWSNIGASAIAWHASFDGFVVTIAIPPTANEIVFSRAPATRNSTSGCYDGAVIFANIQGSTSTFSTLSLRHRFSVDDIIYCQSPGGNTGFVSMYVAHV